jgi:hypothetical protein
LEFATELSTSADPPGKSAPDGDPAVSVRLTAEVADAVPEPLPPTVHAAYATLPAIMRPTAADTAVRTRRLRFIGSS